MWRDLPFDERAAIFLRAADLLAGPWRDTLNAATMLGQSKTVLPGRDRRGLRADRLPAVQRRTSRAQILAEQPMSSPGRVEPVRPPAAGGLRLRDHAVQLHRDRRQPADRAGADGQHGGLEAVADPAVRRALHDAAARGGRPAARRDQPGHRRRPRGLRGRAGRPGPGRHPLHRLDRDVPAPVARRSASNIDRYRGYPRLVGETGGKDFVVAHPQRRRRTRCTPRWSAARSSTRARSARPRRGRTCRARCGRAGCATGSPPPPTSLTLRRRHRLRQLRRRGDRPPRVRPARRRARPDQERRRAARCSPAARADDSEGFFVRPTVVECTDPTHEVFTTEYFGPILGVHVYDDADFEADGAPRPRASRRTR